MSKFKKQLHQKSNFGKAKHIIDNTHFTNPPTFIVHCYTKNLERTQSNEEITEQVNKLVNLINEKYPQIPIIPSLLLPTKDETNKKVKEISDIIEKMYSQTKNISLVHHNIISNTEHLHDPKHLNKAGVKLFAKH